MSDKHKEVLKTIYKVISNLLAWSLILIATAAVIFYANGYRIGRDGVVEITGVLTIKSDPHRSDVTLNGVRDGRTTKTFSSLSGTENYTVEVSRNEYHTWRKTLTIAPERSTPLFAYLFRTSPERKVEAQLNEKLDRTYATQFSDEILFTTVTTTTQPITEELIQPATTDETAEDIEIENETIQESQYKFWKYNTTRRFWQTSDNPQLLLEFTLTGEEIHTIDISPDGSKALLTIAKPLVESPDEIEVEISEVSDSEIMLPDPVEYRYSTYLIETNQPTTFEDLDELDLNQFLGEYEVSWSQDNNFLILESDEEIISFNTGTQSKVLLLKKSSNEDLTWTTDSSGSFYYVNIDNDEDGTKYSELLRQSLSGSAQDPVIEKIYSYETEQFIEGDLDQIQTYFTNSKSNPRFAGNIENIESVSSGDYFVLGTQFGLYWYSTEQKQFILISNKPGEFISVNPISTKLIYKNGNEVGVFTYDKEDEDHTERIGSKLITQLENEDVNISWHSNSDFILLSDSSSIKVIDDEGDNFIELIEFSDDEVSLIKAVQEEIVTIELKEVIEISRYTIH